MRFVSVKNGWVNLDYVASIDKSDGEVVFRSASGVSLGHSCDGDFDVGQFTVSYVPAAAGDHVVSIKFWSGTDDRPCDADACVRRYKVIAWKIVDDEATPVLSGAAPDEIEGYLIPTPGGGLLLPFDQYFNSLEEAFEVLLKREQETWDKRLWKREQETWDKRHPV